MEHLYRELDNYSIIIIIIDFKFMEQHNYTKLRPYRRAYPLHPNWLECSILHEKLILPAALPATPNNQGLACRLIKSSEQWWPEWRQKIITALTTPPPVWVSAPKHQYSTALIAVWVVGIYRER